MLAPSTEAELSAVLRDATGPFEIVGGGTRPVGAPVAATPLSTAGFAGIRLYEPGALTLVAGAGTPLAEIEAALAEGNQRLPFEPMDHRGLLGTAGEPTIGGVVAANVSGPRRIQVGACRDSLIGVRFVDGRGEIIKNGGRVMKNVTGYDLVKLLAGSHGTLGVLTEVAFKVLPRPDAAGVVMIEGLSDARAVEALAMALGSPFEVSGAAHVCAGPDGPPVTMLRVEGFAEQVDYRTARLQALLAEFGPSTVETDPVRTAEGWAWIRDAAPFHGTGGDVWRLSLKPSDAPALVAKLNADRVLYDWGGGLVWAELPPGTDARARLGRFDGHATLVRASAETRTRLPVFQPDPAPLAAITKGLRAQFDPRGLLNPGRMG